MQFLEFDYWYNNSYSQSVYCVDCQLRKQYFMSCFSNLCDI